MFLNNCCSSINPDLCSNKIFGHGNESTISTNRDTIHNKYYSNISNKKVSHFNNFENYTKEHNNIFSSINKNDDKNLNFYNNNNIPLNNKNSNYNSKKILNLKNDYYCNYIRQSNKINNKKDNTQNESNLYSSNYRDFFHNENNSSIKNKTLNILNLKSKEISDCSKNNSQSFTNKMIYKMKNRVNQKDIKKRNSSEIYNDRKIYTSYIPKKYKNLIIKNIFNNNSSFKNRKNNLYEDKIDFDSEKKQLELIKQQYIDNTINTQKLIYELKNNLNKIDYDKNNILELNNKCLKYSDLVQPDNLYKYREENIKNLQKYKPKQNYKTINKRPISSNNKIINKEKYNNKKNNIINRNNSNIKRKKYLSADNIKRKGIKGIKEKNKNVVNNRVLKALRNEYKKNKLKNNLDYYNYLLKDNEEKKRLFCDEIEYRQNINQNEYFRNSPYIYNLNFHKHFYSQNIDKNLHLKYIYSPDSDINQKLYIQKSKEENNKDYYINSFSYKRKNKIL